VDERRADYEEALEIWRMGEPEEARDALRYALEGCGANLWVHVALGRIALEVMRDRPLARGHFGYAVELVEKALPPGFDGTLPRSLATNVPYHEAAAGLVACLDALGLRAQAQALRERARRLAGPSSSEPRSAKDVGGDQTHPIL
jgi:hypothetical protein